MMMFPGSVKGGSGERAPKAGALEVRVSSKATSLYSIIPSSGSWPAGLLRVGGPPDPRKQDLFCI